jgi:hypothetical protein
MMKWWNKVAALRTNSTEQTPWETGLVPPDIHFKIVYILNSNSRDNSVGIAMGYVLDNQF